MAIRVKIDSRTIREAINFVRLIYEIGNSANSSRSHPVNEVSLYNPYELLGLSPQATNEEIKQRYRQLAIVWHPDKQCGNEAAMKRLNKAYGEICQQRQIKA